MAPRGHRVSLNITPPPHEIVRAAVERALAEDIGDGDVTTEALVPADLRASAEIVVKSPGVLAGLVAAAEVFQQMGARFIPVMQDGDRVSSGHSVAATVDGPARAILTGERTALNFVQRLSGIASATALCVDAVAGTECRVLDTRKTVPGLRELEKYAVRCGGGHNHRAGLHDMVLIKDNHIALAGGVSAAIAAARAHVGDLLPLEVEVRDLAQLEEALAAGAKLILLDNMDPATLRRAVEQTDRRAALEASGGVTPANIREIARIGVDRVSLGWITHSAPALDVSLNVRLSLC